jgi:hypothetical protein
MLVHARGGGVSSAWMPGRQARTTGCGVSLPAFAKDQMKSVGGFQGGPRLHRAHGEAAHAGLKLLIGRGEIAVG